MCADPTHQTPTATPIAVNPNVPVGKVRFSYFNGENDTATFSLTSISAPAQNLHLEAWLVSDDQTFRDVGKITFDTSGITLLFHDPDGNNLLDKLSQVQITEEQ